MQPIILIGPIGAGKTTIGKMLAKKLSMPFYSLDEEERRYTVHAGYDAMHHKRLKKQKGMFVAYEYARNFFDEAVIRFLEKHKEGILDFGGGHPIVPDHKKQQRIIKALRDYPYIFLLLPVKNIEKSLRILRKRNKVNANEDFNILYFKNKAFWKMAKYIVYTDGKTPKQCCEEIMGQIEESQETIDILSNLDLTKSIRAGIADMKAGRVVPWEQVKKESRKKK